MNIFCMGLQSRENDCYIINFFLNAIYQNETYIIMLIAHKSIIISQKNCKILIFRDFISTFVVTISI